MTDLIADLLHQLASDITIA